MTAAEMRKRKKELGLTNEGLAEQTGISVSTIAKVVSGVTKRPRNDTLQAIARVLYPADHVEDVPTLRDVSFIYENNRTTTARDQEKGYYTIEDCRALSVDRRVELIDGKLYDLHGRSGPHQIIVMQCWKQLEQYIDAHDRKSRAMAAPFDVLLDRDSYTVVQPDVMVFCSHPEYALETMAPGAPDFVIEVLSPTTRMKDCYLKTFKYCEAGVKEYWIVDPEKKTVTTYYFEDGDTASARFTFAGEVPVRMTNGMCNIDFEEIDRKLGLEN